MNVLLYMVFNLVGHFVLATQGLLQVGNVLAKLVISAFCLENYQCPTVIYNFVLMICFRIMSP